MLIFIIIVINVVGIVINMYKYLKLEYQSIDSFDLIAINYLQQKEREGYLNQSGIVRTYQFLRYYLRIKFKQYQIKFKQLGSLNNNKVNKYLIKIRNNC